MTGFNSPNRKTLGSAIMAAMLAAVVAVPFSVNGQPAHLAEADVRFGHRISVRPSEQISVQSCLRFGFCPEGRANVQTAPADLDRRILLTVHGWNSRSARRLFGAADASAYPVFASAPIALWGSVFADRLPQEDAVAGTVALAAGFGTAMVLKHIVGRSRPYAAIDGFSARSEYAGSVGLSDTASFPSGHATLAGLIATGAALLIRHPAATVGAVLWAGSVSVSRVWLGVHYASDVGAGLALGSGASLLGYSILR